MLLMPLLLSVSIKEEGLTDELSAIGKLELSMVSVDLYLTVTGSKL